MRPRRTLTGLMLACGLFMAGDLSLADRPSALESILAGEKLWGLGQEEFAENHRVEWLSAAKECARWKPAKGSSEEEIGEVLVRFEAGKVGRVEMSVYNRGDDGSIRQDDFLQRLKKVTGLLDSQLSVRKEVLKPGGSSTVHGLTWKTDSELYLLEYSYIKEPFRPEYIMLKIAPAAAGRIGAGGDKMKSRGDLEKELVREANGDVLIKTVPMVDQGDKGYCAVASAERVMRYYGVDVNQHEMAQISNTGRRGTSGKEMSEALAAAAGKYHTRVLTLFEYDYTDEQGWEEMSKVADSYNRLARKAGKRQFDTEGYWISIGQLLAQGDAGLLKQVRASGTKYERFESKVHSYIDAGVPLLWAVYLGVFEEEGMPQPRGGHMRLIIGYNQGHHEILYTDSWGAGHELKRMKLDEAYTMTMQLTVLQPAR